MAKKMLIDATHPEETRVAVVSGNKLEEFDFESSTKKQLKGNIYLAKVTRVEPSLQAAFVDYGGNRHGFLAFNEIHPDYYRIPIADREALIAEEAASTDDEGGTKDAVAEAAEADGERGVETLGGDEAEDLRRRHRMAARRYKIQEVILRRQVLLVQVQKEERGNKGAALTTYISLPGRYCVLMPNTPRGGGISRKITNPNARKRLKGMLDELKIPPGMAVILRTAGMERSKAEIKRDYDYLVRLWDEIRETTLSSTAPALIYEEGNLIKRSIRDLYSRDINEVLVDGEEGYRVAKDFMKMLIPSHARRVQPYKDGGIPLLHRYQIESQIDHIHSPIVQLKSGAYIVINSTEALVAIDVNSGRATRERNIEETALRTNLEAAEEIARQLRLRDLAGLIVIDFIDMEETRNQSQVERKLKEALRQDRARIQVGRISPFGLLEMSRQRLRPSLIEASTESCPTCGGAGVVRSTESMALQVLRVLEEEGMRRRSREVTTYVPTSVALYVLNHKRPALAEMESRYNLRIQVRADDALTPPNLRLERIAERSTDGTPEVVVDSEAEAERSDEGRAKERRKARPRRRKGKGEVARGEDGDARAVAADSEAEAGEEETAAAEDGSARRPRRRGRRGGRRRSRKAQSAEVSSQESTDETTSPELSDSGEAEAEAAADTDAAPQANGSAETPKPKSTRRRRSKPKAEADAADSSAEDADAAEAKPKSAPAKRARRRKKADSATKDKEKAAPTPSKDEKEQAPQSKVSPTAPISDDGGPPHGNGGDESPMGPPGGSGDEESALQPSRRGWWNRIVQ